MRRHLSRRRRISRAFLVVMLASGVAELVSLRAVLPFWQFSASQSNCGSNLGAAFGRFVGITESSQLLIPATLVFAVAALMAGFIRLTNLWLSGRLAAAVALTSAARPTSARFINLMVCIYSATALR